MAAGTIYASLEHANQQLQVGSFTAENREFAVQTGDFLHNAQEVGAVVIGVSGGRPVYLRDVAEIRDGPAEPSDYVLFGLGHGAGKTQAGPLGEYPAVTLTVAKRKGKNAVAVADRVLEKVNNLKGTLIPAGVEVTITRNYGETAQEKSNELLKHLLLATLSVTLLIALALGWRSSAVVLAAVPVTLALTLFLYFIYGYTLNRVTLFALIFSIGILVDDAIVVVENITRHFHLPENKGRPVADIAVEAVDEVGNPTTLATWAVIAAILPMAFVGGLMGPYMRPIPIGASVAMLFSLLIAFVISPWAAIRLLKREGGPHAEEGQEGWSTRLYRRIMTPLLLDSRKRRGFLVGVVLLLLLVLSMPLLKIVRAKMLPFDNKSELQVIVDMPDGTTLEQTARVTREIARRVAAGAGGHQLSGLCGHGGTLQLQRAGAALLPAAGAQPGGHPGEPAAQGRALRPEPRHRQARAAGHPADRGQVRSPAESGGDSSGAARSPDAGRRNLRAGPASAVAGGGAGPRRLQADTPAWWTWTGTSKMRSPNTGLSWIKKRQPSAESPRIRSPRPCAWP